MNTKEIAGFATAFSRAGQDGLPAANVFNKVTNDITRRCSHRVPGDGAVRRTPSG